MTEVEAQNLLKHNLSEYEQLRNANIERNEEFLKSLGLTKAKTYDASSSSAHKKTPKKPKVARRKSFDDENEETNISEPRRRSRRIQQISADDENANACYFQDNEEMAAKRPKREEREPLELTIDDEEGRRRITAPMMRKLIEETSPEHDEEISNEVMK
jgi:hypothetical protein